MDGKKREEQEVSLCSVIVRGAAAFAPEIQGLGSCQQCHPTDSNFQAHSLCLR